MGPTTVLLRRSPIDRVGNRGPQMRNEQRSVPSKDKGKCGHALWGWPLVAHMWEDGQAEWQASAGYREGS